MITNETYGTSTLPTSTVFPELSTFRGHQKNATFSGHEAIFSACCPQPCAIYNPKIEINSCHSYHSHPDHWRDTNHLSHVHASDEDQMRDATQSPQLVLGPKLLAKAAKSSQLGRLALDFDVDFPYNVDSGCCWSLRNSCNWYEYQYNWYKNPFILSFILRKKKLPWRFWTSLGEIVNDRAPESLCSIMKYWISHKPQTQLKLVKNAL